MKKPILSHLLVLLFVFTSSLQAGTKEDLVRLQNDVITLQNQFREFDKTLNENHSSLKSLIEQLNDQAATSNVLLNRIVAALEQQASGDGSGKEEIVPEIQELSSKLTEVLTSISALARQVSDLKVQSQPINRRITSDLSSADTIFDQAFNDLVQGNWELALQGFNIYLNRFPSGDKAAAARYHIGEVYYNMNRFPEAINVFSRIIDENSDSGKVASALYKRGLSALELKESENAITDFKNLIEMFPEAPESGLAKAKLQTLGISNNTP
jgi:tol-pal system protein YbgF